MPVPLIVLGVTAAAKLYGAHKAAEASKKAAAIQVTATDKAQAANQQAYDDQKAALSPYMDAGKQSLADLQNRLYGSQMAWDRVNGFIQSARGGMPAPGGAPPSAPVPMQAQPPPPQGGQGAPPPMSLAAMQQQGGPLPQGQPMAAGGPQGQLVTVRAPTGEMARFPAGSPGLADALRKGAQQVQA